MSFMFRREQLLALGIMSAVYLLIGIYMRTTYILPFFIDDNSIKYLVSAATGATNAWRPAGYSRTVQLLHGISPSVAWLFLSFYLINALTTLYFLFSVKYFYSGMNRALFYAMAGLTITCPTVLFCTNGITNEGLYASFTVLFMTFGLHLLAKPSGGLGRTDLLKVALLILLFNLTFLFIYATCYNAVTFIPTALLVLLLWLLKDVRHVRWYKFLVLLLPFLTYGYIHNKLKKSYQSSFKVNTISAYSGWQKMNNITPLIPSLREMDIDLLSKDESRELYHFLMQFPDSIYSQRRMMSNEMIVNKRLPMHQFLFYKLSEDQVPLSVGWAKVGMIFDDFANDIMSHYPWLFICKYIGPSAVSHYHFFAISEWQNPVISESVINKYFNSDLLPDGASYYHNGALFGPLNAVRHAANYFYCGLLTFCIAFFILRTRWFYRRRRGNSFWLLCALNYFVLIAVVTRVFIEPTTSWRLGLFYFAASMALMAMVLNEIILSYKKIKLASQL